MKSYFDRNGYPMPPQMNPAEFVLDLVNTDFSSNTDAADTKLLDIQRRWEESPENSSIDDKIKQMMGLSEKQNLQLEELEGVGFFTTTLTLLHRAFIKSYRDVVAYGIRIAMYLGK